MPTSRSTSPVAALMCLIDITALDAVKSEGATGTTDYTFQVTRTSATGTAAVHYTVLHGTTNALDFSGAMAGTVVFAEGQTSQTITLQVRADAQAETDERFKVVLSGAVDATVRTASASGLILDDDVPVLGIVASQASAAEGQTGATPFTFTVTRSSKAGTSSVDWAVVHPATEGTTDDDFTGPVSGTVTFANGEDTKRITVNARTDLLPEESELFQIVLTTPVGARLGTASATGTIVNDDFPVLQIAALEASKVEGSGGTTSFTFRITRSVGVGTSSVSYVTRHAGTSANDFTGLTSGSVQFAAGETTKDITLQVVADRLTEVDEGFTVQLVEPVQAVLGKTGTSARATILDDDVAVISVCAARASRTEGQSGTTPFTFTVTRNTTIGTSSATWAVEHLASGGTNAEDFTGPLTGTVRFGEGESSKTVTVQARTDLVTEQSEDFRLVLSSPAGAVLGTASALGTIINDDFPVLGIAALSANKAEGSSDTTDFTFRITRSSGVGTSTVSYTTQHAGTAASDFTGLTSGTVQFAEGVTSQDITLQVVADSTGETSEGFRVVLSEPMRAVLSPTASSATGTIVDDDTPVVSVVAAKASRPEGDTGLTPFTFTVTRNSKAGTSAVNWAVEHPATGGTSAEDFSGPVTGTVRFAPGEDRKTVTVNIKTDALIEATEDFRLVLSAPVQATIGTASAIGTVINDDFPVLRIAALDTRKAEGSAGTTDFTFRVQRSVSTGISSVRYTTLHAGTSADDFTGAVDGTVLFAEGETSKDLTVQVVADSVAEAAEAFQVRLSDPSQAVLDMTAASATGTILNDDTPVIAITATSAAKAEGRAGGTPLTFTVTRNSKAGVSSARWAVEHATTNGTSADDFTSALSGHVIFAQGEDSKTITLEAKGDLVIEYSENFQVVLSTPVGATLGTSTATGTIVNDDKAVIDIAPLDASKAEGSSGTTDLTFTVSRNSGVGVALVNYGVVHGSTSASDFTGATAGTVQFADGQTSQVITLTALGDETVESDEGFKVVLSRPVDALLGASAAAGNLVNDDTPTIQLTAAAASIAKAEGQSGTTPFTFTVTRNTRAGTSSVDWALEHLNTDADDFTGPTSGTVRFAEGEYSKTITVQATTDRVTENSERFTINLTNGAGADLGVDMLTGTIVNDDFPVLDLEAVDADKAEDSGLFVFRVTRSTHVGIASARYAVVHLGTSESDFQGFMATSGTVRFNDGDTTQEIRLPVWADSALESDESFQVVLFEPVQAVLGVRSATGTIRNDDVPRVGISADTVLKTEGSDTTPTPFSFTVGRDTRVGESSVNWTVEHAATHGTDASDFTGPTSGVVHFLPGQTSQNIVVNVAADRLDEGTEFFSVLLSSTDGTALGSSRVNATILDDDPPLVDIAALKAVRSEGASGTTPFTFTVTRNSTVGTSTIAWAVEHTDTSAADFTGPTSGTLSFADGEDRKTLTVTGAGDLDVERSENFAVVLSNPNSAALGSARASGTIVNDDLPVVGITALSASQAEGSAGTTAFNFRITRSDSLGASSVQYAVVHAGTSSQDFAGMVSDTVRFAEGETTRDITVLVVADSITETDEGFRVQLASPTGAVLSATAASAAATIVNDDTPATAITALQATRSEGTGASSTPFTFQVTRDTTVGASTVDWAVVHAASGGTSAPDFTGPTSGTVSFANGQSSQTITLGVVADAVDEGAEAFEVVLSNPVGTTLAGSRAAGLVLNDDQPVIGIATLDASKAEGQTGTTSFTFTVTRNTAQGVSSVNYAVVHGGTSASDFSGVTSGTVTFASGETSKTLTLTAVGDTVVEASEGFQVQLSQPTGAVLGTASAAGSITNDDTPVISITATGAAKVEGTSATSTPLTFTVDRNTTLGASTVHWTLEHAATGGTNADDFTGATSGSLSFADGEDRKTITVQAVADQRIEDAEQFSIVLSNPGGATLGTASAVGTIANDDQPILSIAALVPARAEGSTGTTDFRFEVTRSAGQGTSSVGYTLVHGSTSASDFSGATAGTVQFADGQTSQTITLTAVADTSVEDDERFSVLLTQPMGGVLGTASAAGQLLNDDFPVVSIAATQASRIEGDTGTTPFVFTVTRNSAVGSSSVAWALAPGATDGTQAEDFTGTTSGTVRFAAGENSKTIQVAARTDLVVERSENFTITLSTPVGATLGTASAVGTIINDDQPVVDIVALDAVKAEGATGTTPFTFTVSRSASIGTTSVNYNVVHLGTAASDFSGPTGGTVDFADGETSRTITLGVIGDGVVETTEGFKVLLSSPMGGMLGKNTATGSIVNDDLAVIDIAATRATRLEGDTGTTDFTFTVSRSSTIGGSSVQWRLEHAAIDGTDATDFSGDTTGTVRFTDGESRKSITVQARTDQVVESAENFSIVLSQPVLATLGTASALGTIVDDDQPVISIAAVAPGTAEGDSGTTGCTFTVSRSSDQGNASVNYSVVHMGTSARDFSGATAGTVQFAAGQTTQTITLAIAGDRTVETSEDFKVLLSAPQGGILGTASANGRITNDDTPTLDITLVSASKVEGSRNAVTPFTFTVTRDTGIGESSADWRVVHAASGGTDAEDFSGPTSGVVRFANGQTSQRITLDIAANLTDEATEDFEVVLSNPVGTVLGITSATGTILNDDRPSSLAPVGVQSTNFGATSFAPFPIDSGLSTSSSSAIFATLDTLQRQLTGNGVQMAAA